MRALRRHRPPRRHVECGAPAPPRYGQGRAGPGLAATSTRRGRFLSGRARPPRAASGAPLKCGAAQGGAHHRRWRRPGAARWVPSARSAARPALSGAGLAACGRGVRRWAGRGGAGLAAGAQPGASGRSLALRPRLLGKRSATPSDVG